MMDSPLGRALPLSLEELCVRTAIDNLDLIGDVGHTDSRLLRIILPHCTVEQLFHIEESTKDRDLSQITNQLWLKCYTRKFGEDNVQTVMKRMEKANKFFKWKALYQTKLREQEEVQKECVNRLRELYKVAGDQKASRKLQQVDLIPPASRKRQFGSGGRAPLAQFGKAPSTGSDSRGRLMKKARKEYAASHDAKRTAAARRKSMAPVRRAGVLGGRQN